MRRYAPFVREVAEEDALIPSSLAVIIESKLLRLWL
jgi:hypothetical protein